MQTLIKHIAEGVKDIDDSGIPFRKYQPGVGPYGEPQLVKRINNFLKSSYPHQYPGIKTKRLPDVLIPQKWALEIKIVRPFGDNGVEAEHWSQNLVHPYEGNVSSIGDIYKLLNYDGNERKGVVVISYEHSPPIIGVSLLVECFEKIAREILNLPLLERHSVMVTSLVHPVHQQSTIYGWEIGGW